MTDDNNVINKDVSMDGNDNVKANIDNPFVGNKPDNVSMSEDDVDALNQRRSRRRLARRRVPYGTVPSMISEIPLSRLTHKFFR